MSKIITSDGHHSSASKNWKNPEHLTIADVTDLNEMIKKQTPDHEIADWLQERGYNPAQVVAHFKDVQLQYDKLSTEEKRSRIHANMTQEVSKQEQEAYKRAGIQKLNPWDISF